MIKSKSFSDRTFGVFTYVIITLMTLLCLLPLLHMVALSFSDKEAVSAGRVGIWPMGFNLEAYKMILSDQQAVFPLFRCFCGSCCCWHHLQHHHHGALCVPACP